VWHFDRVDVVLGLHHEGFIDCGFDTVSGTDDEGGPQLKFTVRVVLLQAPKQVPKVALRNLQSAVLRLKLGSSLV
jgi:hypothetical protein